MRYMLLIYVDPNGAPTSADEQAKMHADYGTFTEKILASGEMLAGDGLLGVDVATTVRVRGGSTTSTDGPFAETKEVLGGFYMVDVVDLDRAIELAAQIPAVTSGSIEIRPVMEQAAG